ncbi:MAG: hypothetical protein KDD60_11645, partial [Bdellovibrionales bacterium]|nr:hypothetical protein [Bdellovibrionales bacterium]
MSFILPANENVRSKLSKAGRFWLRSAGSMCCPVLLASRLDGGLSDNFIVLQYNLQALEKYFT